MSTVGVAALINYFKCATNPVMLGRIIASVGVSGYSASVIFWWIAGNHFNAMKNKKGWSLFKGAQEKPGFVYENIA
jgi:hypothetical protein